MENISKIIKDFESIDVKVEEKDEAIMFLRYIPKEYERIVATILYAKEDLSMEDVRLILNSSKAHIFK